MDISSPRSLSACIFLSFSDVIGPDEQIWLVPASLMSCRKLFLHYFQLMRKHRPAVVLTYTSKPNVYAGFAAHLLGIPIISNVTGFGSVLFATGLKRRLIIALFRRACRLSSCVMFQNEANMRYALEHGFVKGEYQLIPGSGVALASGSGVGSGNGTASYVREAFLTTYGFR